MQKIYLLLRNNKQSGPYDLDELLQLTLKPFDLIWVEGKGGGWSYPTEIDALKKYVAENPVSPEEKETISLPQSPISGPSASTAKNEETNTRQTQVVPAGKKNIYISLPAGKKIAAHTPTIQPEIAATTEEESPEAKLERKAIELRNKIQAFTENKKQPKAADDLDTKYTRSLEDIKEEYSSWLYQQQKKKTVISKKPMLAFASLVLLLLTSYFIFPLLFNAKTNSAHVLTAGEIAASVPVSNQPNTIDEVKKKKPGTKAKTTAKKIKPKPASQPISKNVSKNKIDVVDDYLDSLKSIESKKRQEPVEEVVYETPSASQDGSRKSTKREDGSTAIKTVSKKETDTAPFTELIKLSESTGSGTPHLSLYNNSNRHIKFVAIDVFYYKANQKLLQKKTLYFNDVAPKSSAKLFVPQQKNVASVRYEMGLISTDGGLYYAKQ